MTFKDDKAVKMTNSLIICAQTVVFPKGDCREGPFHVVVEKGLIMAIKRCTSECSKYEKLLTCQFLTPGFVDIHNHGIGE